MEIFADHFSTYWGLYLLSFTIIAFVAPIPLGIKNDALIVLFWIAPTLITISLFLYLKIYKEQTFRDFDIKMDANHRRNIAQLLKRYIDIKSDLWTYLIDKNVTQEYRFIIQYKARKILDGIVSDQTRNRIDAYKLYFQPYDGLAWCLTAIMYEYKRENDEVDLFVNDYDIEQIDKAIKQIR